MDSVEVVGKVIEVADLTDRPNNVPCTADRRRSTAVYSVPDPVLQSFQAARAVIVTDNVGQRLRVDLNFAID